MHDRKSYNSVRQFLIRMKILIRWKEATHRHTLDKQRKGLWLKPLSHRPVLLPLLQWRGVFKCDSLRSFWGSAIMSKCWLSFPSEPPVIHLVPREESKFKFLWFCHFYSSTQDSDRACLHRSCCMMSHSSKAILISILLFFVMYNIFRYYNIIIYHLNMWRPWGGWPH